MKHFHLMEGKLRPEIDGEGIRLHEKRQET